MVVKHFNRRPTEEDGATYWHGTRIYPQPGETVGDAYQRQMKQDAAKNAEAAKFAELRRMEGEVAKAKEAVAAKESLATLAQERDALKTQLAERNKPKPRKGIRFGQGFNAFKPTTKPTTKPAA